jgi:hypothetical protein
MMRDSMSLHGVSYEQDYYAMWSNSATGNNIYGTASIGNHGESQRWGFMVKSGMSTIQTHYEYLWSSESVGAR